MYWHMRIAVDGESDLPNREIVFDNCHSRTQAKEKLIQHFKERGFGEVINEWEDVIQFECGVIAISYMEETTPIKFMASYIPESRA